MKRVLAFVGLAVLLSACGGGGSSSDTTGGTNPVPTTPKTSAPTKTSERSDAQNAISAYYASTQFSTSGAAALSASRHAMAYFGTAPSRRRDGSTACSNNTITTTTTTSATSATITVDQYYDASCTTLKNELVWNLALSGTTGSGAFTDTAYGTTGSQTAYLAGTLTMTFNSAITGVVALTMDVTTVATSQTAASTGQIGIACSLVTPISCGTAAVADLAGAQQGTNVSITATQSGSTVDMQLSAQAYTASSGMSLAEATFPNWTITGGTQVASLSGSLDVSSTSVTANLTDAQYGTTVTLTAGTGGGLSGTIASGSATEATFTVDGNGNGTISYSDGSTATISGWLITG